MDVISKTTQNLIRTLTPDERDAVIQYVLGEQANPDGIPLQPLLIEWYDNGRWLKCDCHPETDDQQTTQSIEHLRKQDNGSFDFVRNSSTPLHMESCAFHGNNSSAPAVGTARSKFKNRVLNFHSAINTEIDSSSKEKTSRSTGKDSVESARRSSLGSLLLTLADDAGLNQRNRHDDEISLSGLTKAADQFEVTEGISLSKVFSTSLTVFEQGQLGKTLRTLANDWPQRSRPYGLMAGTIDSLEQLDYQGAKTSLGHPHTSGPYLVLATFTNKPSEPNNRFYYLTRIVTMPIVEKNWPMPVESNLEREVAKTLKRLMYSLLKEYQVEVTLNKPLLDTQVGNGNIRCDFILSDPVSNKTLAIEVMGFKNAEYRERKERQIPLMRTQYSKLIEVEMSGTEEEKKKNLTTLSREVRKFFG